jgi:hypothetical protein
MGVDLSKLSDADLEALSKQDLSKVSDEGLAHLAEATKPPSLGSRIATGAKDAAAWVGDKYERYATAPMRSAIGEELKNGLGGKPISAFMGQMGQNPANAPSGQEIAEKIGVPNQDYTAHSKEPSPTDPDYFRYMNEPLYREQYLKTGKGSDYTLNPSRDVGAAVEIGADPLLMGLGPLKVARGLVKAGGEAASLAGKAVGAGLDLGAKGLDLATGSERATGALNAAVQTKDLAKAGAEAVYNHVKGMFNPHVAEDFPRFKAIAEKNGIDPALLPESVEFGQGSSIDSMARANREGPAGGNSRKIFQAGIDAVHDAHEQALTKMGGGPPLGETEAGAALRDGYQQGMQKFFDNIEMTRDRVVSGMKGPDGNYIIPPASGLMIDGEAMAKLNSKVNGIEKYAKGLVERGIDDADQAQGKYLLNAIQQLRNSSGSFKQMTEAMRSVGKKAFGKPIQGQIPHDIEKLRDLYFAMDDAQIATVGKHISPDFANELQANNKAMSEMFKTKDQVAHILSNPEVAPEAAFRRAVVNADTDQIEALRKILDPNEFNRQRAAFVHTITADKSFDGMYSAMRRNLPRLSMWFRDDPQALQGIVERIELGQRFGKEVLSTSGTGASNVFHDIGKHATGAIRDQVMLERLKNAARTAEGASKDIQMAPTGSSGGVPVYSSGAQPPLKYIIQGTRLVPNNSSPRAPAEDNDTALSRRLKKSK